MDIREAARLYMHPVIQEGKDSPIYLSPQFSVDQEKIYGKDAWKEACTKARTEYNFGSNAVRW